MVLGFFRVACFPEGNTSVSVVPASSPCVLNASFAAYYTVSRHTRRGKDLPHMERVSCGEMITSQIIVITSEEDSLLRIFLFHQKGTREMGNIEYYSCVLK